ncbi:MAG TPA: DUF642 domain-containing protein [Rhodanobacteraceae bacterium]
MKLITLGVAAALAVGSIGLACATPTITNGDFSSVNASMMPKGSTTSDPAQFGNGSLNGFTATQFINGWMGNDGYEIWEPNATAATTQNAYSEWGIGGANTGKEMLWAASAPPSGSGSFVALDGDQTSGVQSSISQTLTGLTVGQTYAVTFDWGLAQMQSRNGATTNSLKVSFGDLTQTTPVMDDASHSFNGWFSQTFNFKADSTSALLSFLAVGTPSSLPPMALLSNVSIAAVPEPPVLAMFGGGLLGLGLLTVFARRRQQRRDKDGDLAA